MADYLYPDITLQTLKLLEIMRRLDLDHADYWDNAPYPQAESMKRYFRSWFHTELPEPSETSSPLIDRFNGEDKYEELYRETVGLFAELKNAKPSAGDTSESMSYFKTISSLLDRLLSYQERSLNLKQIHQFHSEVLSVMDHVLTPDQRNEVMDRLKTTMSAA